MIAVFNTATPCGWASSLGDLPWCLLPIANRPLLIEVSTTWPSTWKLPPKYSPTIAPMNASVVLTLSAVKNGVW